MCRVAESGGTPERQHIPASISESGGRRGTAHVRPAHKQEFVRGNILPLTNSCLCAGLTCAVPLLPPDSDILAGMCCLSGVPPDSATLHMEC